MNQTIIISELILEFSSGHHHHRIPAKPLCITCRAVFNNNDKNGEMN